MGLAMRLGIPLVMVGAAVTFLGLEFTPRPIVTEQTCVISAVELDKLDQPRVRWLRCKDFEVRPSWKTKMPAAQVQLRTPLLCTLHLKYGRFTGDALLNFNTVSECHAA